MSGGPHEALKTAVALPRRRAFREHDFRVSPTGAAGQKQTAVTLAPPTIDAALKTIYDSAAIYFPFTDLIVSDPYADLNPGLKHAYYVGQSTVIGGTTTDIGRRERGPRQGGADALMRWSYVARVVRCLSHALPRRALRTAWTTTPGHNSSPTASPRTPRYARYNIASTL
jgi:Predicted periplasmic protein (DUF2092)